MKQHVNPQNGVVSNVFDAGADKIYAAQNQELIAQAATIVAQPWPSEGSDATGAQAVALVPSGARAVLPPTPVGGPPVVTAQARLLAAQQASQMAQTALQEAEQAAQLALQAEQEAAQLSQATQAERTQAAATAQQEAAKAQQEAAQRAQAEADRQKQEARDADPAKAGYADLVSAVGAPIAAKLQANGIGTLEAAQAAPPEQLLSINGIAQKTVDKIKGVPAE